MQDDEVRGRAICERIRQRCKQRGWYGPDCDTSHCELVQWYAHEPFSADEFERWNRVRGCPYQVAYDADSGMYSARIDRTNDPLHHQFEYLPATEQQLLDTEAVLGHRLPPMLRMLYSQLANGGFGPAYGIVGVKGGWTVQDDGHDQTLDQTHEWCSPHDTREAVGLETLDRDPTQRFVTTLPAHLRPAHFVAICYDGCGNDHYVDLATGRVYYAGCGGGEDDGAGHWPMFIDREAVSVEQWLEDWLDDKEPESVQEAEEERLAEESRSEDTVSDE